MPAPLTTLKDDEASHRLPHVLPDATGVLFTVTTRTGWRTAAIEVTVRGTAERRRLGQGATDARYLASGHLAYMRAGVVLVAPFDPVRLELTGPEIGGIQDVMHAVGSANTTLDTGAAQVSFSETGTAAFVAGGPYPRLESLPVWVDRRGRPVPAGLPAGDYRNLRLSHDGNRLAFVSRSPVSGIKLH